MNVFFILLFFLGLGCASSNGKSQESGVPAIDAAKNDSKKDVASRENGDIREILDSRVATRNDVNLVPNLDPETVEAAIDSSFEASIDSSSNHDENLDASSNMTNIKCEVLPELPQSDPSLVRHWFSRSQTRFGSTSIPPVGRIRVREQVVYIAAGTRPLRIDWNDRELCELEFNIDAEYAVQDLLAPEGSSKLVVLFGSTTRIIYVSDDDGQTWTEARSPAPRMYENGMPSALVFLPGSGTRPEQIFATYGGATLDVSENGGYDWTRLIDAGIMPAQGFAIDTSKKNLWYITEGALDRVAAYRLQISDDGRLPTKWSVETIPDWDANGVYSAEADPFDPNGIYFGGEGRLGYLRPSDEGVQIQTPWRLPSPYDSGQQYTYVTAIWPDPEQAGRVFFGGGQQGDSEAALMLSTDTGSNPSLIPFEESPKGVVRGVYPTPDPSTLLVVVEYLDRTLGLYLLGR